MSSGAKGFPCVHWILPLAQLQKIDGILIEMLNSLVCCYSMDGTARAQPVSQVALTACQQVSQACLINHQFLVSILLDSLSVQASCLGDSHESVVVRYALPWPSSR